MTTKTILLIYNEPNMGEVIHACLADLGGWNVVVASSTLEGLRQARRYQPDAIIFDFSLTQIGGLLCLKQLRENPVTQHLPVVLLILKEKWVNFQPIQQNKVATVIVDPPALEMLPVMIANVLGWD